MKGKPLTWEQRIRIEAYWKDRKKPCEIARLLCVHHSAIYRELKKGMYPHNVEYATEWRYSADIAQQKHEYAQTGKGRPLKIGNDHQLAAWLEYKISVDRFSPAAALGEIKRKGLTFSTSICVTTLYNYIDQGLFLHLSNKHLWVKSKRKKQEKKIVRRIKNPLAPSIEDRPKHIDWRDSFGHWEMDTVVSAQGKLPVLLVLTERMTRKELIFKLPNREAKTIISAMDRLERKTRNFKSIFQSITMDNGGEFSDWHSIERSIRGGKRTKVYFCHPYSSSERGSNENCNGIIRRFIPKGSDIGKYTDRQIRKIETWINDYPRRIHDYCAAEDLYKACVGM